MQETERVLEKNEQHLLVANSQVVKTLNITETVFKNDVS